MDMTIKENGGGTLILSLDDAIHQEMLYLMKHHHGGHKNQKKHLEK